MVNLENNDYELKGHLSDLVSRLEDALKSYSPDGPDHGLAAAKAAVGACIRFAIHTIPNGIYLIVPLRDLLDSLDDLSHAKQPPMLRHVKKKGERPIRRSIETFRAMAAVLMEVYHVAGDKRLVAAEMAAQDLNENGYCDERGKPIDAKRLEDWRDKVSEGGDSVGATRFSEYLKHVNRVDRESARKLVFDSLDAIPGNRIPNGVIIDRNP